MGEGALQAVARALLKVVNLPGTQRAHAGMGKVLDAAQTRLPAKIGISVSKQLTPNLYLCKRAVPQHKSSSN